MAPISLLMTIPNLYQLFLKYPSVQTDTRKLKEGALFFALKGEIFDGNLFVGKALEMGAAYCVADDPSLAENERIIVVEDVLTTLQQLAKFHRQQLTIPFLAITGSNGKTTTKELVHTVLASVYQTSTTVGNLNNHIGVPLTLLSIPLDAEMAVIEMGANHCGEIASYCSYTLPTHGLITNCGKAHLEGFGGVVGVRKGKGELFDFLRANNGTAFIYAAYDYLEEMSKGIHEVIRYGDHSGVAGIALPTEPFISVGFEKGFEGIIHTKLIGNYNLPNVLATVAIGKYFNVPEEKIRTALETYYPSNSRSQLVEKGSNRIILDAYNANPSSMKLAIENLAHLDVDNKILVLGAMAELGDESVAEHRLLVECIKKFGWKEVLLVGGDFEKVNHSYKQFASPLEAGAWMKGRVHDAYLLIKGSRSTQMEKVLEFL